MKLLTEEQLMEMLQQAYMAGWNASGEGYNSEYPENAHESVHFTLTRDSALNKLIHADAGGYDSRGAKVDG